MSRTSGVKEMSLVDVAEQPEALPAARTAMVVAPDGAMLPMIERLAAMPDFDVAKLSALLDMQERILNRNAEAAFNVAFAAMQADIPTIIEKGKTDKGHYARQEDIVEIVRPILKAHGFSLSFCTEWPSAKVVKVVGILTHTEGHSRKSEFQAEADNTGSKNAIQALGSSVTYGRRYTTTDLLNITSREQRDDDGEHAGRPEPPEGFQKWWDQLKASAEKGSTALEAAYACSQDEPYKSFRKYLAAHGPSELAALKVRAKQVTS